MELRRLLSLAVLTVGLSSWGAISRAQIHDLSKVQIKTIPVANGIYMLEGEGGNIGVATSPDGIFLVDDQFAPLTEKITAAIATVSPAPIKFLINTHWHFDHTGGNENLGKQGVVLVAHDQVRKRMSTDQFIELFQRQIPASPIDALPVVTFNDTTTFHLNGQRIHAFHIPAAHTDGDAVIHFIDANVIHTGDIFFNKRYPFIDTSSGGSIDGMIAGVEKILTLTNTDTKIIPGHGPLATRADLVTYHRLLLQVRGLTQAALARGLSLEDFIASKPTAHLDEEWGKAFLTPPVFLQMVYQDLAGKTSD